MLNFLIILFFAGNLIHYPDIFPKPGVDWDKHQNIEKKLIANVGLAIIILKKLEINLRSNLNFVNSAN